MISTSLPSIQLFLAIRWGSVKSSVIYPSLSPLPEDTSALSLKVISPEILLLHSDSVQWSSAGHNSRDLQLISTSRSEVFTPLLGLPKEKPN